MNWRTLFWLVFIIMLASTVIGIRHAYWYRFQTKSTSIAPLPVKPEPVVKAPEPVVEPAAAADPEPVTRTPEPVAPAAKPKTKPVEPATKQSPRRPRRQSRR